jgi:hypothetical protein
MPPTGTRPPDTGIASFPRPTRSGTYNIIPIIDNSGELIAATSADLTGGNSELTALKNIVPGLHTGTGSGTGGTEGGGGHHRRHWHWRMGGGGYGYPGYGDNDSFGDIKNMVADIIEEVWDRIRNNMTINNSINNYTQLDGRNIAEQISRVKN